ncbi:hypothetical protein LTR85_006757 [Meristemomyces frigidus]|nr:hypothetical protein LTR85_006757 [Meristemomyces frigidus]
MASITAATTTMRIEALMAPYRDNSQAPPFTDAEIIAMILLFVGTPLTFTMLLARISSRFLFFSMLAAQDAIAGRQNLVERFADASRQYDLPVIHRNGTYRMDENEGLFFLRKWYDSLPCSLVRNHNLTSQPFRFFDLPRELRNVIHDMVFGFPRSGISIDVASRAHRNSSKHRATVMTRHLTNQCGYDAWDTAEHFTAPAVMTLMAPISSVKKLSFHIDQDKMEQYTKAHGKIKFPSPLSYPGIKLLAKIKTLSIVELGGDCGELALALKGLNVQLTVKDNGTTV